MGLGCILAPVLVNKLGVKRVLILGSLGWSVYTAALYQNNRYGTEWFVILGAVICGISAGFYWASEGAILLSYPEPHTRARMLAVWLFFKNSGQIIAGAINLATNVKNAKGGKGALTLISFIALQVFAVPVAFLVSGPEKVKRSDGSSITLPNQTSTKEQFRLLWRTVSSKKVGCLLPIFFVRRSLSLYWGLASSHLTLYYSVRARALASFLSAICGVIMTTLLGFFLDNQRIALVTRVRVGGAAVFTLFLGMLVWALVIQHEFETNNPGKLDWTSAGFGRGFGMYVMLNAAGNALQNYLYWIMSLLAAGDVSTATRYAGLLRGIESWGQCCAFGINSSKFSLLYTVVINLVFYVVSLPFALVTLRKVGVVEGYGATGSVEDASAVAEAMARSSSSDDAASVEEKKVEV
ncbi:uncharacterized protein RHOBADRAFT_38784 [Rhodotorula graminis WP1]|uniref:Major facilitator superfamily (MFS) profile domain-containing protein n=1 Tax=Rhodotorula graminis (strain WP1) TaxID=578459 RepID=A0A0P9EMT4_RHOGW|nr:uncharacterized protein RHOBADRAFT_38784 [Rhodotorula graminis WP1]KPV73159.1 hypothetical protein RHOBADRAFT_38784 [Rhodotorula graminis WP1]